MDRKPKARSPAKRAAKKKTKEKKKPQSERFVEAARSIGVDETGREFGTALKKIVPPKLGKKKES
jgi:hypothetical protein